MTARVTLTNPGPQVTVAPWANPVPRLVKHRGTVTVDEAAAPSLIGSGWTILSDDDTPALPAGPAKSASKAEWLDYAATVGVDGTDKTRDQIIEAVEKAVEQHTKETTR